ncbi:MAG: hypothetical protein MI754_03380, partial [Chromatiales bacterium]|nr:hypothetical protein [Chromatiales bacterium]
VSVADLSSRKYGHNTKKLVKKAIKFGLSIDGVQKREIISLQGAILDRYIETGFRTVLTPEALYSLCAHLNSEIGAVIYEKEGITRPLSAL